MHVQCSHYIDLDPYIKKPLYIEANQYCPCIYIQFPRGALFIGSWVNSVLDIDSCIETTQYTVPLILRYSY